MSPDEVPSETEQLQATVDNQRRFYQEEIVRREAAEVEAARLLVANHELEAALWYLAATLALRGSRFDATEWVADAKRNWRMGMDAKRNHAAKKASP